ncbi:unnamed protein product [Paramecium octaurelia]|uniref:Uncharacterized protein n=1 Tax=Paramecium octaurelia TaxID=43137 RepID=A0A8S1WY84_PAROT|nr:unnamed protein product [Paramecium octaurelia]
MQNYQNSSTYELENSFSEKSFTVAMAINQDNKILITSSLNYGKAFQFKWGSLKTMKLFQTQQRYITNINFFKKNSQFVTCSIDSSIIIWSSILLSLPKYLQKLNSHKHSIYCLAIRPNDENLIISGGVDCTIKFLVQKIIMVLLVDNQRGDWMDKCIIDKLRWKLINKLLFKFIYTCDLLNKLITMDCKTEDNYPKIWVQTQFHSQ